MASEAPVAPVTSAVFFDVDFTLIYPGPMFQAEGYQRFCAAHGIVVDPSAFAHAVEASSGLLDDVEDPAYNHQVFVDYTAAIITHMGGRGPLVQRAAQDLYDQWAANHHFEMYDDVDPVLRALQRRGLSVGVISNSHRSLDAFRDHFSLGGLIQSHVSSFEHGYMKPHPSIFEAALERAGVAAGVSVMVGDSLKADVGGALAVGMRAVLLRRSGETPDDLPPNVPVIRTLADLEPLL